MRSTFIAVTLALAAQAVYAQLDKLPECASPCLLSNISKSGCEDPTSNFKCVCESEPFVTAASECIQTACKGDDITNAMAAAAGLCKSFGVDIGAPSAPEETTTAAPETTSTPAAAETTTVVETTTVAETTTVVETTTVAETTAVIETPDVETTTPEVTTTPTVTGTGNLPPPGNTTSPTVPPPSTSDSAAVKNIAGLGAAVMAVAALFAL